MLKARKHPHETDRVASLKAQNILDTLPEKNFDQITFLASVVCETPIALISLVDNDRQWFKSRFGLDATETHRDIAFCSHAILQNDIFSVNDASADSRFFDNPLVTEGPQIQFYAGAPLLSPEGYPIGTVCVIDTKPKTLTSAQERALQALSEQVTQLLELRQEIKKVTESEEKLVFKTIAYENISNGVVLQDQTGAIVDFNPAALAVLGLTSDELLGKTSMDASWSAMHEDGSIFPGEEHPAMVCLRTSKKQNNVIMGIRNQKNGLKWIKINSVPLFFKGASTASHAVTSFEDITDLRLLDENRQNLQHQLAESARLSTLGEMASGVAHEINNPLAIIKGKVGMLKRKLIDGQFPKEVLSNEISSIEQTVDRIAKIISGLRTYSRDASADNFEIVRIKTVIQDTLELCREKLRFALVDLQVTCKEDFEIRCRTAQISQILVNLLGNSLDAISNDDNKWIKVDVQKKADRIQIRIIDSGEGINPGIVKKMMNPFFTTKQVGKGTGLGLSISKGIAESHGGSLQYEAEAKNTTFVLELPAA